MSIRKRKTKRPRRQSKRISRQRRWQLNQLALGNCILCGRPRHLYAKLCDFHSRQARVARRKKYGLKPHGGQGHGGRPPIDREIVTEESST